MAGLAEAMQGAVGQPASVRIGTVDSVNPLAVSVQGVPFSDVGVVGLYSPQIGDSVALLGQCSGVGSDPASWMALGTINAGIAPIATLRQTIAQSLPTGSSTHILFDIVDYDNAGGWDPDDPSVWVAPVTGVYQLSGGVSFAANAAGVRTVQFRVNSGTDREGTGVSGVGSAAVSARMAARTVQLFLEAGEWVEITAFHNAGIAINTAVVGVEQSTLEIRLIQRG